MSFLLPTGGELKLSPSSHALFLSVDKKKWGMILILAQMAWYKHGSVNIKALDDEEANHDLWVPWCPARSDVESNPLPEEVPSSEYLGQAIFDFSTKNKPLQDLTELRNATRFE